MSYDIKRYTKATTDMIRAKGKEAGGVDYDALDRAHECDRLLSALATAAANIAERATKFATDIDREGYVSGLNNPVSTSLTFDVIRNEALFDVAKAAFLRAARRAFNSVEFEQLMASINEKVSK